MKAQTAAAIPLVWASSINNWSVPFFNVPMTVVSMAALGSLLSFAWGEREEKKSRLYLIALASTFMGIITVAVFPDMMGWEWVSDPIKPPLAGGVALAMRFVFPNVITLLPEVLRKIFRLDNDTSSKSYRGERHNQHNQRSGHHAVESSKEQD